MKKKYLLSFIIIFIALCSISPIVFTQSAGGPAARTGAPLNANQNEQTCTSCHGEQLSQNAAQLNIAIDGNPAFYEPGNTYTITVTNTAQAVRRGFQMVAIDENYANAGTFTISNVTRIIASGGRSYICHNNPNQSSWSFQWTAPASPVGKITFYACSRSSGNGIFTKNLSLDPQPTSIEQVSVINDLKIYPNPTSDYVIINGKSTPGNDVKIDLTSLNGQLVHTVNTSADAEGCFSVKLDVRTLRVKGLYLLRFLNGQKFEIRKIQII